MTRYFALAVATKYWKPGTDYSLEVADAVEGKLASGDYVVVSEKAISIARSNILDENSFEPSFTARLLATTWTPIAWGYLLGVICHFGQRLLRRIRNYPVNEGSRHKQVSLQYAGFTQSLMFGSEGGIDGSNLPYSLVSMPLKDAYQVAEKIYSQIRQRINKNVTVIIVDTDKTYSFRNFHFTPRPQPMKGIHSHSAILAYVIGRVLRLRRRPTPLAAAGEKLQTEEALTIANVADHARGPGSGATVWDMAARFKVSETNVTWDMLAHVKHRPIVIVRRASQHNKLQGPQRQKLAPLSL